MKKLVVLVFVVLVSVSTFAINENPAKKEIRSKIVQLLGKTTFEVVKDVKTDVEFLINQKGELVVLNITGVNQQVCDFVKSRLNYKKVSEAKTEMNKVYQMPLIIKAK